MKRLRRKQKNKKNTNQCPICKSYNTIEWYSADINIEKLAFTYEFSPESQKTFRVVRCQNCTHVFCAPLPKNIYKNYENVIDEEYLRHANTRIFTARAVLNSLLGFASSGKILDIGCATGDFLSVAKDFGFSVEGLELSRWSGKIAQKKGIKVYKDQLKSLANKLSSNYDLITLWGVVEHFENPLEEMNYINQLLKPGGCLAVWTGNVDGLMSKVLGRKWWYWQGQHLQYFSYSSLNHLARLSGFQRVKTMLYPIAATYEQVDNSLKRYKFRPYLNWAIKLLFLVKPIWTIRLPGEMFWIMRKKQQ